MEENQGNNIFNDDDRQYLEMMQSNIERMASNSANCKTWMLTIFSAFMALQGSIRDLNGWAFLTALLIIPFWYLDVFYLHLERGMRNRQTNFMQICKNGQFEDYKNALFNFSPYRIKKKELDDARKSQGFVATDDRWFSKSVFPFYGITFLVVVILSVILNWSIISERICICGCMK